MLDGFASELDRFDWSDPDLSADSVTRTLIGSCRHWRDEWRPGRMVGLSEMDMEILILREAGWTEWGGESPHGKPYFRHLLALMKLMFPKMDITPSVADATHMFCRVLGSGMKGLHFTGSQNSGKSSLSVRIAFAVMAVFPAESAIYFANPFDSAADSTVWGEVEECYDEIIAHSPGLFPASVKYALKRIELVPGIPKAGTMELRNVKHVGKFKGTKTLKTGEVPGLILIVIDEVNEIYNHAFLTILSNLTSQDGFVSITSQNFKDPYDMGGRLTDPSGRNGGPSSFADLDKDDDQWWESSGSSVTMRFSGLRSPNILAKRVIYSYLFKQKNLDHMIETYGENSPEYFQQVLSFPIGQESVNSCLPRAKINASRYNDQFYTITGKMTPVSFCDPSFGGGDKAMWAWAEFGDVACLDANGSRSVSPMIVAREMRQIRIIHDMKVTPELLQRMVSAGIDTWKWKEGFAFSVEDQVALACREFNAEKGIPDRNFGYDFSMRPDIVTSMGGIVGPSSVPFDYNTKPVGFHIHSIKSNSEDACRMRVDELAFLCNDIFSMQRIRNGSLWETAILQASRTKYEIRSGKRICEKKKEYKGRWQNQSPDERDTMWGVVGMAYKTGFRVAPEPSSIISRGVQTIPISKLNKFRRKTGTKLPSR